MATGATRKKAPDEGKIFKRYAYSNRTSGTSNFVQIKISTIYFNIRITAIISYVVILNQNFNIFLDTCV